jgi:hypothetical protein
MRWRVKDLAQLKFSLPPQFRQCYWEKFLELYFGQVGLTPGRQMRYRGAIDRKARRMLARNRRQQTGKARQAQ